MFREQINIRDSLSKQSEQFGKIQQDSLFERSNRPFHVLKEGIEGYKREVGKTRHGGDPALFREHGSVKNAKSVKLRGKRAQ